MEKDEVNSSPLG